MPMSWSMIKVTAAGIEHKVAAWTRQDAPCGGPQWKPKMHAPLVRPRTLGTNCMRMLAAEACQRVHCRPHGAGAVGPSSATVTKVAHTSKPTSKRSSCDAGKPAITRES